MSQLTLARADTGLLRVLGVWTLAAAIVNLTIGGGVYALPGSLATTLGAAAPAVYILGAVVFIPIAFCFSAAGSRVAGSGGAYYYVRAAFGPFPGFVIGTMLWISNVAGSAGVAAALIEQLARILPALEAPIGRAAFIAMLYGGLCVVNGRGSRASAAAILVLAAIKLLPLMGILVVGPFFVHSANVLGPSSLSWASVGSAMVIVIFAYSGMENALSVSGEVANPSRTIPLATLTAVAVVVVLYFGLQLIAQGVLGSSLAGNIAPLAAVSEVIAPGTYQVILAAASVSIFGILQGDLVGSSRLIYAMAGDGFLPAPLAKITAGSRVPVTAIVVHSLVVCALTMQGSFESLALMSGGAYCFVYLAGCAAAWQLQRRGLSENGTPFTLPGGIVMPLVGCVGLLLILSTLQRAEWMAIGYCLAPVLLLYAVVRWQRMRRNP